MPVENVRVLARTWAAAWEHPSVWTSRIRGEYLFVGADVPLRVDFPTLAARYRVPAVAAGMQSIRMPTPSNMLGYLIVADDGLRAFAGNAVVNTDDNSRIEYDTPRGMWQDRAAEVLRLIHAHRVDPWDYVVIGDPQDKTYLEARQRGERILADQYEIMRALELPVEERRRILQDVLARDPHDATARRHLKQLPRQ
jgi:hypothetical protein